MKILVTGGAGFIGSNIVRSLLDMGHEPVVLDNLTSGYRENLIDGVKFIEGDIRDRKAIDEAIVGCERIINLAASVGNKRSIDHPIDDSQINVLGVLNLLEAARANGIKKMAHSSSAGIFGELKTIPIKEDHDLDPDTPYGVSKLAGEKHCLAYNKLYGMENVCLRYFNVYGLNQRFDAYGNVIPIFAMRVLQKRPITIFDDGEQTRDFVNVKDVAKANIQSALKDGVKGVFNIGSGTRITVNKLADLVIDAAGEKVPVEYGPKREGDVRDSLADISKAEKEFGFVPDADIAAGLKEYFAWLKNDPLLPEFLNK